MYNTTTSTGNDSSNIPATIEPDSDSALFCTNNDQIWIIDGGCTKHIVPSISDLTIRTKERLYSPTISVANKERLPIIAVGSVSLQVKTSSGIRFMTLTHVLVVPGISSRLFSCRWGYEHDKIKTLLNSDCCLELFDGSRVPFVKHGLHYAIRQCRQYSPTCTKEQTALAVIDSSPLSTSTSLANLWHARLGHFGIARVHRTLTDNNIDILKNFDARTCMACLSVKRRKGHPSKPSNRTIFRHFGHRIDSDLAGPFPESPHGFTYAINFVDRYSRFYAVYFLRSTKHPNVLHAAQIFVKDHSHMLLHTRQRGTVDEWHTDNGPEFTSNDIAKWAAEMQHRQSFSVPDVHETNPAAERCWGVLLRITRAMLAHAGGDTHQAQFWPYLMFAAVQRHNNLYSYGNEPAAIPAIKAGSTDAIGIIPIRRFKVLLCDCWVQLKPSEVLDKISPRRIKAVHLGFDARRRGYFVYIPELQRLTTISDVDFVENSFTSLSSVRPNVRLLRRAHNISLPEPHIPSSSELADGIRNLLTSHATAAATIPIPSPTQLPVPATPYPSGRPVTIASADAAAVVFLASSSVGECYAVETDPGPIPIPRTFHEAVNDPTYGDKWRAACDDDIHGKYKELKTWELIKQVPAGRKPIKGKWVFVVKYKADGSVDKFKARYVGCGYSQVPGVDYTDTFCSTLRLESLRAFLSGACINDDDLLEADVIKAFPSGDWDGTEIYLMQPPGYENPSYAACRLLRPLEGTKQAGHLWMTGNAKTIASLGFERCSVEPNVWRKTIDKNTTIRIAIYVDNLILRFPKGQRAAVDTHFLVPYAKRYNITIMGEPTCVLGIQISRNRKARTMTLTQTQYIDKMYTKFCSDRTTKDFSIPVHSGGIDDFHSMTPATDADYEAEQLALGSRSILELLGSLLWATSTRPDVQF